jgi:ABC-2 type transport system permease protein
VGETNLRVRDSALQKAALAFQVFKGSINFGRKGTIIWDSYEMWVMQILILPLMQMAFFAILSEYLGYPSTTTQYIVIGNALQIMSFSAVFAVANITSQDKWQGTLVNLLVTPANRMSLFVGRAFFQVLMSTMIVAAGLTYSHFIFGVDFSNADMPGIVLVVVITSLTMISFGLLISSIGLFMRTAMIVANIFLFLTLLVSGVNFPVSELPIWLQPVSYAIPLTYGISAMRMAISGSSLALIFSSLVYEIVDGLAVLLAGYLLLIGFERLARRTGKVEEY